MRSKTSDTGTRGMFAKFEDDVAVGHDHLSSAIGAITSTIAGAHREYDNITSVLRDNLQRVGAHCATFAEGASLMTQQLQQIFGRLASLEATSITLSFANSNAFFNA